MKRSWFVFVAVGSLFLPSAGTSQTTLPVPQLGGPVLMTYWEARAAGLGVSALPSETGFRVCTDSDFSDGFSSAEEAERSLAEYEARWGEAGPGICQVDPTTASVAVFPSGSRAPGMQLPTGSEEMETAQLAELEEEQEASEGGGSGGQETGEADSAASCVSGAAHWRIVYSAHCSINIEGTRDTIEVGNPSLCHTNCTVAKDLWGQVEAQTQGGHNIVSAWVEATWKPEGQWPVALFDNVGTPTGPDLGTGQYYIFRVRHNGSGGSAGEVLAEWWDGSWHVQASYDGVWCMDSGGGGNCQSLHGTLVHAGNDGWFNVGAPADGLGVNHKNIQLRNASGQWKVFKPSNFSEGGSAPQAPYSKCDFAKWYTFRTPRGDCLTAPST